MPANDNPHAQRLAAALEKHGKGAEAAAFAQSCPLSKSADIHKKFRWAQQQCAYLSDHFDQETVRRIRMDCACGPEMGKIKTLRALYEKATDLSDFVLRVNQQGLGFTLETDGQVLDLIYPTCYCSCVKRVDAPLPRAWCDCTLGYAQRMFAYILGQEVSVTLMESVKQGDEQCRIRIEMGA